MFSFGDEKGKQSCCCYGRGGIKWASSSISSSRLSEEKPLSSVLRRLDGESLKLAMAGSWGLNPEARCNLTGG